MTARPIRTALLIAAGYGLALAAAAWVVSLRYLWADPADVAASSGMYAGGDLLGFLILAGFFCLVPSYFLWRALRDVERFWVALSWACLVWAASAPVAAVAGGSTRAAAGPGLAPLLALASFAALLRIVVSPACAVFVAAAAWKAGQWPVTRRRLRVALALEACGGLTLAVWIVSVVIGR